MFDERDLIARQMDVEDRLTEAAHRRLLHAAEKEQRPSKANRDAQHTSVRTIFLMWSGHLLIRAGQRLETLADAALLSGASAIYPSPPISSGKQQE